MMIPANKNPLIKLNNLYFFSRKSVVATTINSGTMNKSDVKLLWKAILPEVERLLSGELQKQQKENYACSKIITYLMRSYD